MELNSQNLHPTSSDVPQSPPGYWTNTRDEILSWLNENNSSLADLYKGAVYLTFGSLIPGKLRFISHAVREIRNRLPDSIPKISERLEYKDEVGKIAAIWESNGFGLDEIPPEMTINSYLFSEIQQLIKKHKAVKENNKERTFIFFELCISENQLDRNTLEPIVKHYWDITEWFMDQTHEPDKTHDKSKPKLAPDDQEIRHQFEQFESFLSTLAQKFYSTVDKLDEILTEDNPQQIEKVIGLLIHPQHFSYFFNRLQNPEWIEPLKSKGFFKNPPQIIEDANQGTVSFPLWPQSRYLARIAKDKPTEVLEIIRQIKSNNPRIYEDFVDAALQMPLQQAVQLVPKVKIWIESSYSSFLFPEKVADLIIHLAKGGQDKKALELARTLLVVMPDSSLNKSDNNLYIPSPKPRVRFDNWSYQEIIKKYIPELVKIVGEKALIMLIFLLNDAVKFSISNSELQEKDNNSPILEDSSHYWRYAIEEHPRNHDPDDVKEILLQAVRDTAKQILEQDPTKISTIVQKLEERRWRVFHRIALYLIREYKDIDPNLLIEKLVDSHRFTKNNPYEDEDYEYAHLLKENFDQLPLDKQEQILNWIDNPQIDWDCLEDQDKKAEWVRQWQQAKLTIIKDSLSIYWQERYQQLVNEFGNLELTNIFARGVSEAGWLGVKSPKTDSELESMSIEEIVTFLRTWEPKSTDIFEFEEPSRSGLGSALAILTEKHPERYAQGADKFQGLYSTYISNFLRGLRQALNNQSKQQQEIKFFDWISVLSLCNWLAEKSTELNQSLSIYDEPQKNWIESCRTVLYLLEVGLNIDKIGIPFNFRNQVWNILRLLTQHPDPTPERESSYYNSNNSYSTLAINSVRGEAIEIVVRYALWIRRHFEQIPESAEQLQRGFDEMPEVREVLDEHLNLEIEPSLAIRSVYGKWFPWLGLLDRQWASQSVGKIFPQDETFNNLRRAAWETYINFSSAYDNIFDLLHEEYCYAVEHINTTSIEQQKLTSTDKGLANHLMSFYWHGKLTLDEPRGLIIRFFELASDKLRGYALEFMGRSLKNTENDIEPEILNSLQLLWKNRLETACNSSEPNSYATELAAFGWWFGSAKFEDSWAISQIKQVLELVGELDPDFLVLKRLTILVDTMPESVVECLELMIKKDNSGWDKYGWRNETGTILNKAIQSNCDQARKIAESIIQDLGKRGNLEYRKLLPDSRSQ